MDPISHQLRSLPARKFVWQGGVFLSGAWVRDDDDGPYEARVPVWIDKQSLVLHLERLLSPEDSAEDACLQSLLGFALKHRFRPTHLEVKDEGLAAFLSQALAGCGIQVVHVTRTPQLDGALQDLRDHMSRGPGGENKRQLPGPLDGPGLSEAHLERLAAAAGEFYRAAPWRWLTDSDRVQIEAPGRPESIGCCVVMGAGRQEFGLSMYESLAAYAQFERSALTDEYRQAFHRSLIGLTFEPLRDLPQLDVKYWSQRPAPAPGERPYPMVMKYQWSEQDREPVVTRASGPELDFIAALLRAFAQTTEEEIDRGRWEKRVDTPQGALTVELSLPDLLDPPTPKDWLQRGYEPDRRGFERAFADMDRYFRDHPPGDEEEYEETVNRLWTGPIDRQVTVPQSPLERAQDLCYQACDAHGRRRVQLAREALRICPDCAEAYVIQAEQTGDLEAKLEFYAQGTRAGERALGTDRMQELVGMFWDATETRPYMRARLGLAMTLFECDRAPEAIEHLQELLRLNPMDNQAVRYLLMPLLIDVDADDEAEELLVAYDEPSAIWAYSRALLAFRRYGESAEAREELHEALRINPHVPDMLLSDKELPQISSYAPGSPEEAVMCVEALQGAYDNTPEAFDWLDMEHHQYKLASQRKQTKARRKGLAAKRSKKGAKRRRK